jgi:hypothetical protein
MVMFWAPAFLIASRSFFLNTVGVMSVETMSPVPFLTLRTISTRSLGASFLVRAETHTRWTNLSCLEASFVAAMTLSKG